MGSMVELIATIFQHGLRIGRCADNVPSRMVGAPTGMKVHLFDGVLGGIIVFVYRTADVPVWCREIALRFRVYFCSSCFACFFEYFAATVGVSVPRVKSLMGRRFSLLLVLFVFE